MSVTGLDWQIYVLFGHNAKIKKDIVLEKIIKTCKTPQYLSSKEIKKQTQNQLNNQQVYD